MAMIVSCDEVFDSLTRGPFIGNGAADETIERHLRCCHDCRQIAEALRPAIGLFHESLAEERLPCFDRNGPNEDLIVDLACFADQRKPRRPDPSLRRGALASWATLAVAASLIGLATFGSSQIDEKTNNDYSPMNIVEPTAFWGIPPTHPQLAASNVPLKTSCCVNCHQPGRKMGRPDVMTLAKNCKVCHATQGT